MTPVTVTAALVRHDMWWMIGSALALLPFMKSNARLSRMEGAVLAGRYVTYLVVLLRP